MRCNYSPMYCHQPQTTTAEDLLIRSFDKPARNLGEEKKNAKRTPAPKGMPDPSAQSEHLLKTKKNLDQLRSVAEDREQWRRLSSTVPEAAEASRSEN
ncbi:hypothetical protein ElyMa_002105500 [Elysia marginata]|uniref:Uncharacterized protein n=1 Tax=Elysia marginata TaxID=1093978 RepID=A0AAV4FGA9_9GAST|nr:hypothetical protein ElyMa_002105500 [Elysia marginata]